VVQVLLLGSHESGMMAVLKVYYSSLMSLPANL